MIAIQATLTAVALSVFLVLVAQQCDGSTSTFRRLFQRYPDQRLSAVHVGQMTNVSVDQCSARCITESRFRCKSFDYDNVGKLCRLFTVSLDDPDVHLIDSAGRDNYQTAYSTLFNRLPNHRLPTGIARRIEDVSAEECARRCVLEVQFKCRGFNYRKLEGHVTCLLLEGSPAVAGTRFSTDTDYYQRNPEGSLANFINYGTGKMNQLGSASVYQKNIRGIGLEDCAAQCLEESSFDCESFDYIHEDHNSVCHLSKYIAANVYGLQGPYLAVSHYERIGSFLAYFYSTPYVVIPGNDVKTYTKVTPNRCARTCMEENSFICRSFEYKIQDGTCVLSDKTGSDVGLRNDVTLDSHYFEMKPLLDCGGFLSDPQGNLASPNWPRNYAHHEECFWNITTTSHKVLTESVNETVNGIETVLHLHFTHFELGLQSSDPCSGTDDRLVVSEPGISPYCVLPNTQKIVTKSNRVTLTFHSNGEVDAQGFRAFYSAEWTCDTRLNQAPGQFASPNWPDNYPSGTTCSWRIEAPLDSRIRVRFTSFELEQHTLGHCNERFDHVKILNGGTVRSPLIGLYCGSKAPFTVRSSGRDMFVQFNSDRDPDNARQGFHAFFTFERHNGTVYVPDSSDEGGYVQLDNPGPEKEDESSNGFSVPDVVAGREGNRSKMYSPSTEDKVTVRDGHYKRAMWAVVTVLTLALMGSLAVLYLVVRYYRQKIADHRELIIYDPDSSRSAEEVPLQPHSREASFIKPNNLGNEVGACGPGASACCNSPGGATGGNDTDAGGDYGKYSNDNAKNINLDTKPCNV